MFTEFRELSRPIVGTPDMLAFIEQAPAIFGDTWKYLCDLRGVKPSQKEEKERNIPRMHSIFYDILAMARIANRKKLKHWAFIRASPI